MKSKSQPVRAAAGAFLGTTLEWYDFYCYGIAAALVFSDVFFPKGNALLATLASLGTFAVGFVARPVGALVFGHFGDRLGRKKSLVATLLLMGAASTLIGILPTFESIGASATIMLIALRILQGIAVGGEWGGAVLIASEHAPGKWRAFLASAPQYGSPVGLILATVIFNWATALPGDDFQRWGWRVPFLLSALLLIVAFAIRGGVNESPEFEQGARSRKGPTRSPLRLVLATHKRALICGLGLCMIGTPGFYFITTFMIAFATQYLQIPRSDILSVTTMVGVSLLVSFPIGSFVAMKIGERRLLIGAASLTLLWSPPLMLLVTTAKLTYINVGIQVAAFLIGCFYAVLPSFLMKGFPVEMRYTGISVSLQVCGAVFGGTTPIIGTLIASRYGTHWLPLAMLIGMIAFASVLAAIFHPIEGEGSTEQATQDSLAVKAGA